MLRSIIRDLLNEIKTPQGADMEAVKGVVWENLDMDSIVEGIVRDALNVVKGAKNSRAATRALKEYFEKKGLSNPEAAAFDFMQRLGIKR